MKKLFLAVLFGITGSSFAASPDPDSNIIEERTQYSVEFDKHFLFGGPDWNRVILMPYAVPKRCPKDLTQDRYTELAEKEAKRQGLTVTTQNYSAMVSIRFMCAGKAVHMKIDFASVNVSQQVGLGLDFELSAALWDNITSFSDMTLTDIMKDGFEYYIKKNNE